MHVLPSLTRLGRRGLAATTSLLVVASTLAVGVSVALAPAASAADTIGFRASAQSAANQQTQRVIIPAAVRDTDSLLLFVTSNKSLASVVATPAGWLLVGSRLSGTDTETIL
jgi:hypothetical protein